MNPAVHLAGAAVERGGLRVVQGVDLTVARRSWFGLIGANGSGKTSLLRALAGRLPFAGGSCRVNGEELAMDRAGRALRFGFSPPADKLPDALRGRDVLELVGGNMDDVYSRLGGLHVALGLAPLLNRWIGDCSAGMRQRIAIAAAFAGGHTLVILDEPFNWLDPVATFDLRKALREMVDDGLTLVTAMHDLSTLATVCDAGAMLADGKVAMALHEEMLRAAAQTPHRLSDKRSTSCDPEPTGGTSHSSAPKSERYLFKAVGAQSLRPAVQPIKPPPLPRRALAAKNPPRGIAKCPCSPTAGSASARSPTG